MNYISHATFMLAEQFNNTSVTANKNRPSSHRFTQVNQRNLKIDFKNETNA